MSSFSDVQLLALALVLPDPENVNQHDDTNIGQIKASIERFGFADPMAVVPHPDEPGRFLIVEGHGRRIAAEQLGLDEVPCIVLTLDEAHRRGYAIAHNQTQSLSRMDQAAVAAEFGRLGVEAGDFNALGYTDEDVAFLPALAAGDFAPAGTTGGEGVGGVTSSEPAEAAQASAPGGFVPTVHRTSLVFASSLSYNRFVHMVGALRDRYPLHSTIGERMIAFMTDTGMVAQAESTDA